MSRRGAVVGGQWMLVAACLLAAGCGGGRQTLRGDPFGEFQDDQVRLTVHNNDYRDAVIYAVWNGYKDRVGMVTGTRSQTFAMKWKSEWIRVQVSFIGDNEEQTSDQIPVTPGDHLDYVILGTVH